MKLSGWKPNAQIAGRTDCRSDSNCSVLRPIEPSYYIPSSSETQ